ncbi:cell division protein FtsZ [Candidatus Micrarchaeota archaeon]|nr:cell division protein FtsZ [Candidatus Micrarchaeota archaeon]
MESIVRNAVSLDQKKPVKEPRLIDGPKIVVVGVGGAGNNSVNRIARSGVQGAELIALNTDKQHLTLVHDSVKKVLIGQSVTRGLGAGGYPEVGAKAAEVSRAALSQILDGTDLLFLTAGLGGGTGTGAGPIVADVAKEQGAIVIAMVTYPFRLERARLLKADEGLNKLRRVADTVIIIDNNRLVELVPNLPIEQAFSVADEVIARAVKGITETITTPSLINLDYMDVRAVMTQGGVSVISVGESKGHQRVEEVVEDTLKNSLLDVDYAGAKGALIHITGGPDLTLGEANQIGEKLTEAIDPGATVIWGARIIPEYEGKVEVIAIMTGVRSPNIKGPMSESLSATERSERELDMNLGISYLK